MRAKSLNRPTTVFRLVRPVCSVPMLSSNTSSNSDGVSDLARRRLSIGDPQRKQRIFQLVGEPARQFPPRGYALGLDEAIALLGKLTGHRRERTRQSADLTGRLTPLRPVRPTRPSATARAASASSSTGRVTRAATT